MRSSTLVLMVCGSLALAACGDDTTTSGTGGTGGSGGGGSTSSTSGTPGATTASSSASSGSASSTTSTSSGDQGGGGSGQGGGTGGDGAGGDGTGGSGTGGSGGSGTGGDGTGGSGTGGSGGSGTGGGGTGGGAVATCGDILIDATSELECEVEVDVALPTEGVVPCEDPSSEDTWIGRFYEITVAEGDCVYMRADNAGSEGADVWGAIIDPLGNNLIFDDEIDCTVANPDPDLACPEGAITMEAAGTAFVMVGAFGGEGCPVTESAPVQLAVTVNGTDLDLGDAAVCEGDLFELL